jgi:acyl carrier protein phosphodiesterase
MNLLAHALLSGERPADVVGGVLADWIKGPIEDACPPEWAAGVRRHRRVDAFVDAHPAAAASRARLRPNWGRYSGILVDLAYDVCLAAAWERFGPGSLDDYLAGVHASLLDAAPRLPPGVAALARRMVAEDWIGSCRSWDRVGLTLDRVSRRLRRPVPLGDAVTDLARLEPDLAADFAALFPEARAFNSGA